MKKKFLCLLFVTVITVTASWNYIQSDNKEDLSDLTLLNVEALANDEGSGKTYNCWPTYVGGLSPTRVCSGCSIILFTTGTGKIKTCKKV